MPTPTYLTAVDTAKLVRAALRAAFPDTAFSVRSKSYAGGSSVTVAWTDGPTEAQVTAITDRFEGADFDPSCDLKSHRDIIVDGKPTRTLCDWVHCQRTLSPDFRAQLEHWVLGYWHADEIRRTGLDTLVYRASRQTAL